ncbi:PAS domain-containing sensor histidine kinase [Sulfitobacter sp. HNIBRBA2951]|uniref:PAS domain-containing sensor histidine kinase n=1 Tax=Sulfitobacter aquimarinus TaxID=3158557 RepID=UPI0032DEAB7A
MYDDALNDLFALVDCIPTPVFMLDVTPEGTPVYAHFNKAALRNVGRELSEIVGHTAIEVFGEEFGTPAYDEQYKAIQTRKPHTYEFQLPTGKDLRVVRTTLWPQLDENGAVNRLIGSAADVSTEWIASSVKAKLRAIDTEVEQFVSMAAHDLRTPMRNVIALADMLAEDFEDHGDGKRDLIDLLRHTADKSMVLITDVLSFASTPRVNSGNTLYRFDTLCDDIMATVDPQGNHTLQSTAVSLSGEKTVMQVVLRNLIDNSIKHGNSANLLLRCTVTQQPDGFVKVTLCDNGKGFANPGVVFLDSGDFRVDSGYGLLAVRRLILARGGTIQAKNDDDTGGSCVIFTLPGEHVTVKTSLEEHFPPSDPAQPANAERPQSETCRKI